MIFVLFLHYCTWWIYINPAYVIGSSFSHSSRIMLGGVAVFRYLSAVGPHWGSGCWGSQVHVCVSVCNHWCWTKYLLKYRYITLFSLNRMQNLVMDDFRFLRWCDSPFSYFGSVFHPCFNEIAAVYLSSPGGSTILLNWLMSVCWG